MCFHDSWEEDFAVKCFRKVPAGATGEKVASALQTEGTTVGKVMPEEAKAELAVMKAVAGHRHCLGLVEMHEDEDFVMGVVQYASQGDLFDYVFSSPEYSEANYEFHVSFAEAMGTFVQILIGVDHLHRHMFVHGDIKLENILIDDTHSPMLADYGHAQRFRAGERSTFFCGTLHYCAPETILRIPVEGPEVDVWSLGVVLYILLHGRYPFFGPNELAVLRSICQASYVLDKNLHPDVQNLLHGMLLKDPHKRLTVWEIKQHPAMRSLYDSYVNFLFKEESAARHSALEQSDNGESPPSARASIADGDEAPAPASGPAANRCPLRLPTLEIQSLSREDDEALSPRILYSRNASPVTPRRTDSPRAMSSHLPHRKASSVSPINLSIRLRKEEPGSPRILYSRRNGPAAVPRIELAHQARSLGSSQLHQQNLMPLSQLSPCNRGRQHECSSDATPRSPKIDLESLLSPHVVAQLASEFGKAYSTDNLRDMALQAARRSANASSAPPTARATHSQSLPTTAPSSSSAEPAKEDSSNARERQYLSKLLSPRYPQ